MNNNSSNKQNLICSCSGTTKAQIEVLIESGMDSITQIAEQTGASTGCGACDYLILEILAEKAKNQDSQ
jgi:NAD(P)H-nitrite reductase large subunit